MSRRKTMNKLVLATTTMAIAVLFLSSLNSTVTSSAVINRDTSRWNGTWAAAPQHFTPTSFLTLRNQSLRLIVHTSIGGTRVRIKISNTFGDQPLLIGGAHIARRAAGPDIDPASDRTLTFRGHATTTIPARAMVASDPGALDVRQLSAMTIRLYLL